MSCKKGILILGGGVLGSTLGNVIDVPEPVWLIDKYSTVKTRNNVQYMSLDLKNKEFFLNFLLEKRPRVIIYCIRFLVENEEDLNKSIDTIKSIVYSIRDYAPDMLIHCSSIAVYDYASKILEQQKILESERTNPSTPYGYIKRIEESLFESLYKEYINKIIILRFCGFYGSTSLPTLAKTHSDLLKFYQDCQTKDFVKISPRLIGYEIIDAVTASKAIIKSMNLKQGIYKFNITENNILTFSILKSVAESFNVSITSENGLFNHVRPIRLMSNHSAIQAGVLDSVKKDLRKELILFGQFLNGEKDEKNYYINY